MAVGYVRVSGRHSEIGQNRPDIYNCVTGLAAANRVHSLVVLRMPEEGDWTRKRADDVCGLLLDYRSGRAYASLRSVILSAGVSILDGGYRSSSGVNSGAGKPGVLGRGGKRR